MNTKREGRAPIYKNAFKIVVAREYITGNQGYGMLAKKYGLPDARTVAWFVKWYKKNYPEGVQQPGKIEEPVADDPDQEQLSQRLKEANLKIAGLEMLIETAQKELGIDIVKKPGTKQS